MVSKFHEANRPKSEVAPVSVVSTAVPIIRGADEGESRWFYGGDDFPCLQIVWPDRAGRFPWEADFDAQFEGNQPDLTEQGWVNEITD